MSPKWDARWRVALTDEEYDTLGIVRHPPDHPLARNRDIVAAVDQLWAFPADTSGQGGTWYTIGHAIAELGPDAVKVVLPDGTVYNPQPEV
jgi:hypothetical protein